MKANAFVLRSTDRPASPWFRRLRCRIGVVLALLLTALAPWAAVSAQEPQQQVAPYGTTGLRFILHSDIYKFELQPLHKIGDLANSDPADTVVIVLGDFGELQCLDDIARVTGGLKTFVNKGGALLVASNHIDRNRLAEFKVSIDGDPAVLAIPDDRQPANEVELLAPNGQHFYITRKDWEKGKDVEFAQCVQLLPATDGDRRVKWLIPRPLWEERWAEPYKGFADCPLLKGHLNSRHPLFARCRLGIATNHPSFIWLQHDSPCQMLCAFPPFMPNGVTRDGHFLQDQAFAVGSPAGGQERLLIVSNHIVFTDGLLGQSDNDNRDFTVNTVRWLVEKPADPRQKRKYALLIHNNKVVDNFEVPIGEWPMPTTRLVNDLLRQLEEENFFNLLVLELLGKGNQEAGKLKALRFLVVVAVVVLIVYGLGRYRRSRHRLDVAVPLIEAKLAQTVVEFVPALVKRDKLALRGNDFREAAQTLARLCFEQSPGSRHAKQPPRVAGRGSRGLHAAVERLWNLAYGTLSEPVSAEEFAALAALVEQVQQGLARGTLQWVADS